MIVALPGLFSYLFFSTLQLPEAKVSLDTPYFKGDTLALCMEKPFG